MQKRHPKCPCANECACVGTIGKWHAILPFHGRCTHINPLKYDVICTTAARIHSYQFYLTRSCDCFWRCVFIWIVEPFLCTHFATTIFFFLRSRLTSIGTHGHTVPIHGHRVLSRRTDGYYDRRKLFFYFFIFSRVNAINPHRFVASIVFTDDFIYFRNSCTASTHWTYALKVEIKRTKQIIFNCGIHIRWWFYWIAFAGSLLC